MRKKLFANWGIKLISLLSAFGLWFAVVYFEDPLMDETFTNIPVQLENTELLTDQGLVYEVLDGTDIVRRVTVRGPKTVLAEMKKDSIVAIADFSEKNMSDMIDIEFKAVNEYAGTITDISADAGGAQLKLFVEEKISKSIPLSVNVIGEVAKDHQLSSAKTEQNRITVTGGKSKVEAVSYAAVNVDVTGSDTDISTIETIRLYDKNDNLLDHKQIQKNINSTTATITIQATKTVPVEMEIMGEPAEGYLVAKDAVCNVETVKITGSDAVLAGVDRIVIPAETLDITGYTDDFVKQVNLKNCLPTGIQLAKDWIQSMAEVTVSIERESSLDLKVLSSNLTITNIPEGLEAEIEEPYTVYDLRVSGLREDLSAIDEARLRGVIDVRAWMESREMTELTEQVYYIPAEMLLPEGVRVTIAVEARITFFESGESE